MGPARGQSTNSFHRFAVFSTLLCEQKSPKKRQQNEKKTTCCTFKVSNVSCVAFVEVKPHSRMRRSVRCCKRSRSLVASLVRRFCGCAMEAPSPSEVSTSIFFYFLQIYICRMIKSNISKEKGSDEMLWGVAITNSYSGADLGS